MKPMEYAESGLGVGQFSNDEIALVGGFRDGMKGTPGTARLRYTIYDLARHKAGEAPGACELGWVTLNVNYDHTIEGIVDLEITRRRRKYGFGRKVVEAILATGRDELHVYDIKNSSVGFWKKLGFEVSKRKGSTRVDGKQAVPSPEAEPEQTLAP